MLHTLRHYLPLRKALLIASETCLLTLVVAIGTTAHLWDVTDTVKRAIYFASLTENDARWRCFFSAIMVSVLTQIAIAFNELYDFRVSSSRYDRAERFAGSAASAIVLVLVLVTLMKVWAVERFLDFPGLPLSQSLVILTTTLIVGFALLYVWRHVFHHLLRRLNFNERILILGAGRLAQRVVDELINRPDSGYEIVGMLAGAEGGSERRRSDRRRASGDDYDPPWLDGPAVRAPRRAAAEAPEALVTADGGKLMLELELVGVEEPAAAAPQTSPRTPRRPESIHEIALRLHIDEVVVAFEERRGSLPTDELLRCRLDGIIVQEVEPFYERLTGKIPAEAMRPSYLIFNEGFLQHPLAVAAKRAVDALFACVAILLTWPAMILTALAVRLDSPGPILFRQTRTGLSGQPFTLLKFRSMRQDAERETGPVWARENDPRITRIGRFIRKTRLDELPQLFNVLGGSMSMVGPRPERQKFVDELAAAIPYFRQRHIVKPGLTGWAQINYPYGNTVEDASQKLQYDLFYIKYQSLLFDLSILFHTIKTVVLRKGT
jgi:exopolysaccharide biosynthesis polyprenyl glycosylphosphotransferase